MTETSSGRPANLQAYPEALEPMDEALDALATELDTSLRAFKAGAGSFAPGFDAEAPGSWVRELAAESRHLGGWVGSVGDAFEEADSSGGLVTVDDVWLSQQVGEPSILGAQNAREGQEAAAELKELLRAAGIDPTDFDPDDLANLDPRDPEYQQLFDLLDDIGDDMYKEDFAVGFYDQMNPDGMRALMGAIEMFAAHQQRTPEFYDDETMSTHIAEPPDFGSIQERLLEPFVAGWARASGSVDLSHEREALLDIGDDPNSADAWKQHQLAMYLSADGRLYDPTFLAEAADVILYSNADVNWANVRASVEDPYSGRYAPMLIGKDLWDDPELAFNELVAMRALAGNDSAAFEYAQLDGGQHREERLERLLRPDVWEIIEQPIYSEQNLYTYYSDTFSREDAEDLSALLQGYGAEAIDAITVGAVRADPSRYDEALEIYADVVRVVGEGDIPDVTKRVVANSLALYIDDVGAAASTQQFSTDGNDDARALDFSRPDLVDFFKELGFDEEASAQVGESLSVWANREGVNLLNGTPSQSEIETAWHDVALVLGAIEDGFNETGSAMEESHAGFLSGLQAGGDIVTAVSFAAIPATGGASLLVAGARALANPLLDAGIEAAAGDADRPAFDGGGFETVVTNELRRSLANIVANRDRDPDDHIVLDDDQILPTLREAFDGDPVDYIDQKASDEAFDLEAGQNWNGSR